MDSWIAKHVQSLICVLPTIKHNIIADSLNKTMYRCVQAIIVINWVKRVFIKMEVRVIDLKNNTRIN